MNLWTNGPAGTCLFGLFAASLMLGAFGIGETKEARFWNWFQKNSDRLYHFERDQQRVFDDLSQELAKVNPGLVFAFGPTKNGAREIIISADGISSIFPAVRSLVAAAPKMSAWKVIAFRPRVGATTSVQFEGHTVAPTDMWYRSMREGNKLGIVLYIRGYSKSMERQFQSAAFLHLDNALGEYDVATKIGSIDFKPLPADPRSAGLKQLSSLAAEVDKLSSPKNLH